MAGKEEITAEIEDTENIRWVDKGMLGKRGEVGEGNEDGSDEDEGGDGFEGEGDAFGLEQEKRDDEDGKKEGAFVDNEVDVDDRCIAEDDILHRAAGASGRVKRGEVVDNKAQDEEKCAEGGRKKKGCVVAILSVFIEKIFHIVRMFIFSIIECTGLFHCGLVYHKVG